MESWRLVWREGIAPNLPLLGLLLAARALAENSVEIVQGATTSPPPLLALVDQPAQAADLISFCNWKGWLLQTIGEIEEAFSQVCYDCDYQIGEPAACRWFLNWWDDSDRTVLRVEMDYEIKREIERRIRPAGEIPQ